jgi:hypothetical protein
VLEVTYGKNAREVVTVVKPHWAYTGVKPCRKVKMRASEKPLTADSQAMMGSVKSMWKLKTQVFSLILIYSYPLKLMYSRATPDDQQFLHRHFVFIQFIGSIDV